MAGDEKVTEISIFHDQIGNASSTCPTSRERLRVTKIFERSRKSLQQRIHVYRASRSPCFAYCELDCSPSFTVVITLSMMLFFGFVLFSYFVFFVFSFFFCSCCFFILISYFLVGGGEAVLRVPLMNRHQSTLS